MRKTSYPRLMFMTACAMLLLCSCTGNWSPSSSPAPNAALIIDSPTFNFGYVGQNTVASHTFWLKSTGTSQLYIDHIVPG